VRLSESDAVAVLLFLGVFAPVALGSFVFGGGGGGEE
jgi:hypothetical protein